MPFWYRRDGDTGPGLTEAGHRLVARCAALGMVVDMSHLTMRGFQDIGEMGLQLVATHSNAYDLCATTRNLTRDQLRAIGQSRGMAGLNHAAMFLSPEGWTTVRATLDDCLRQLDAMIEAAGEDHVGLGSDFDGAPMPEGLASVAVLPGLVAAMVDKLCRGNWLAFLRRNLRA